VVCHDSVVYIPIKHNLLQQTSPAGAMVARKTSNQSLTRLSRDLEAVGSSPTWGFSFCPFIHLQSIQEVILSRLGVFSSFYHFFWVAVEQNYRSLGACGCYSTCVPMSAGLVWLGAQERDF
jgi:hypothetical protein